MPKTTFVRKPSDINDVREGTDWITQRHNGQPIDSYWIAKEVQLPERYINHGEAVTVACSDLSSN